MSPDKYIAEGYAGARGCLRTFRVIEDIVIPNISGGG
jgi:hypothetical protein